MEFRELFFNHASKIPNLCEEGYYFVDFFFNWYGKGHPVRIGCHYSNVNIKYEKPPTSEFFLFIENFPERIKISEKESEKVNGKVLHEYVPDHNYIKNLIDQGLPFASWMEEKKIFTVVNLLPDIKSFTDLPDLDGKPKGEKMIKFIKLISNSKISLLYLPLFDVVNYLPTSVKKWKLVTIPFLHSVPIFMSNELHFINEVQGNYKNGEKYLNVNLRLGCRCCPSEKMEESLRIPDDSLNINEIKINDKNVLVRKLGLFTHFIHQNLEKRYVIGVFNNKTTINEKKYENEMKCLMSETIKILESSMKIT